MKLSSRYFHTQTVKARDLNFWHNIHQTMYVTWHMSYVKCHMSGVTFQLSYVTSNSQFVSVRELKFWEKVHLLPHVICHMSHVMCHVSHVFFSSFFCEVFWLRVCYHWGHPMELDLYFTLIDLFSIQWNFTKISLIVCLKFLKTRTSRPHW